MYKWSGIQVYIHWVMAKPKVEFQIWRFQRIWQMKKQDKKFFFHDREQKFIIKLSIFKILSQKDDSVISFDTKGRFCYFLRMICDISTLHIGCMYTVHTKKENWSAGDMQPICNIETSQTKCDEVTELSLNDRHWLIFPGKDFLYGHSFSQQSLKFN